MSTPTVFISYNPGVHFEETLAIRLQTIGAVNGFRTFLPDRYYSSSTLEQETKNRIRQSDYYVIFATKKLSGVVEEEIQFAFENIPSKQIIIIYNTQNFHLEKGAHEQYTEIGFDPRYDTIDQIIQEVVHSLQSQESKKKQNRAIENGVTAFLGIGLGLLALGALESLFSKKD